METTSEQTNGTIDTYAGDGTGVVPAAPEDSMEYRILMAYAKKRLHHQNSVVTVTSTPSPKEANNESQGTTPKTRKRRFRLKLPSCIRSKTKDPHSVSGPIIRGGPLAASLDDPEDQKLDEVAGKLTEISPTVAFLEGDLDTDCPKDTLVQDLAKLLRDSGDEFNEKIKNNKALLDRLQNSFTYDFFSSVVTAFLSKLNLASAESPEEAQIAMTCEAVTRLSTMDTLPVSQTMGFGARYLQGSFSPWFGQNGGGEQAFDPNDDCSEVE